MKNVTNVFFALAILLIAASCSKDHKQPHWLESKSGKWNIETEREQQLQAGAPIQDYTVANAGTVLFDDDGSVTFTQSSFTLKGKWKATAEQVSFMYDPGTEVYDIKASGKTTLVLEQTTEQTSGSATTQTITTYTLKKLKK